MYQMDAQHSGRSPHAGPRQVRLLRTFDTSRPELTPDPGGPARDIQSSAAIGPDGTIYIGNFPGTLFALRDPGQGDALSPVWRFHPTGASSWHGTPALGRDGTVYLGFSTGMNTPEAKGTLYALRPPTGGGEPSVAWNVDLGAGRQTASPTLGADDTVYAVSGSGKLFVVSPSGTVKWTVQAGPPVKSAPALGPDGTVYLASIDGKLYAVSPPAGAGTEGAIRWTFDFGEHPGNVPPVTGTPPPAGANGVGSGASPTVGPDGTIYIGANNSNFYAVAPDGKLKWMFEAEREIAGIWTTAALSADQSTLYFAANKGGMYALARDSGSLRWRYDILGSVYSSPALDARGVLYTGSTAGHLIALDSSNGQPIFDYDAGAQIWTAPSIRPDGSLVVADRSGRVLLLGAG